VDNIFVKKDRYRSERERDELRNFRHIVASEIHFYPYQFGNKYFCERKERKEKNQWQIVCKVFNIV
jgi:hypothetical protein